jgi:hypothetical protein
MATRGERGAVAVEFAIILPVLLLILLGIMEFGRAYNAANASSVFSPDLADSDIIVGPNCAPGVKATITIKYSLSTLTGIAGPFNLSGKGVMLCGG